MEGYDEALREVALDLAASGHIGIFADQQRDWVIAAHGTARHHTPDGIGAWVIGVAHLLKDPQLNFVLVGRGVSLGDLEGDIAFGECFEDRLGEIGEPQTAFHKALGEAKAFGDRGNIAAFLDEVLEGAAFLSR